LKHAKNTGRTRRPASKTDQLITDAPIADYGQRTEIVKYEPQLQVEVG